jgi:hypothetical protein
MYKLFLSLLLFANISLNASASMVSAIIETLKQYHVIDGAILTGSLAYAVYRYNEYQHEKEIFKQFLDYLKADGCYQGKITQNMINAVDCYSRLTIEHFRDGAMMAYDRVYKNAPSNASRYDILKKIENGELVVVS